MRDNQQEKGVTMAADGDTTERVYEAVAQIFRETGKCAECKDIFARAGVSEVVGRDRLRELTDGHRLLRPKTGQYKPAQVFRADEAISLTGLPSGMVKIEKGDKVEEFTPTEARLLARMLAGFIPA
jgi:hypothetical protein